MLTKTAFILSKYSQNSEFFFFFGKFSIWIHYFCYGKAEFSYHNILEFLKFSILNFFLPLNMFVESVLHYPSSLFSVKTCYNVSKDLCFK